MAGSRPMSLPTTSALEDFDDADGSPPVSANYFRASPSIGSAASWSSARQLSASSADSAYHQRSPSPVARRLLTAPRPVVKGRSHRETRRVIPISPAGLSRSTKKSSSSLASGSLPDLPGAIEERGGTDAARPPKRLAPLPAQAEIARLRARETIATPPPSQAVSPHERKTFNFDVGENSAATTDDLETTDDGLQLTDQRRSKKQQLLNRGGAFEPLPPIHKPSPLSVVDSKLTASEPATLIETAAEANAVFAPAARRSSKPSVHFTEQEQVDGGRSISPVLRTPPCEREPPEGQECDDSPLHGKWPVQALVADSASNRVLSIKGQERAASWKRRGPAQSRLFRPIRAIDVRLSAVNAFAGANKLKQRRPQHSSSGNDGIDGVGDDEDDLDWYLPSRQLTVFVGTWNMQGIKVINFFFKMD